jgi:hypothetical protein
MEVILIGGMVPGLVALEAIQRRQQVAQVIKGINEFDATNLCRVDVVSDGGVLNIEYFTCFFFNVKKFNLFCSPANVGAPHRVGGLVLIVVSRVTLVYYVIRLFLLVNKRLFR